MSSRERDRDRVAELLYVAAAGASLAVLSVLVWVGMVTR